MNPADRASRGCSCRQLLESHWWEGPAWLYEDPKNWPQGQFICNEYEVNKEKRKGLVTSFLNATADEWHLVFVFFKIY